MSHPLFDAAVTSPCMNLRSFRKDGTPVDTPLWVVPVDGRLGCYTDDRSYKVKRLRRNKKVEIAACDVWGRRSTEWYPGVCRFVEDPPTRERIFEALKKKYHVHWWMSLFGSKLTGRVKHRLVLEFTVDPEPVSVP